MINDFLEFLKEQFPNDFDTNAHLPQFLFERYTREFLNKIKLAENSGLANSIIDILHLVLSDLRKKAKCSFYQASYMEFIFDILVKKHDDTAIKEHRFIKIVELFIIHNLNLNSVYDYLINQIQVQLNLLNTTAEKIGSLKLIEKEVFQIMDKRSGGYSKDKGCLKESLLNWIKREVNYFNYNYSIMEYSEAKCTKPNAKIKMNISVGQIACIIKQLIEIEIIETDNKSETIKTVANTFTSKNSHNISEKSLSNKFFNLDETTTKSTKELFLKLFKSIDSQ